MKTIKKYLILHKEDIHNCVQNKLSVGNNLSVGENFSVVSNWGVVGTKAAELTGGKGVKDASFGSCFYFGTGLLLAPILKNVNIKNGIVTSLTLILFSLILVFILSILE